MNHFPATVPRTWVIGAAVAMGLGMFITGPPTLWDPDYASDQSRWEIMTVFVVLAIFCLVASAARWLDEARPEGAKQLHTMVDRFRPATWAWIALGVWCVGWAIHHGVSDPDWVPSGIDWHDTHLDAYALMYNDPVLYSAWRYPLYPALGAGIAQWTGLDLEVATQLLSRILAAGTVVPLFLVGRALYGRGAAVAGSLLLLTLATYRMHTDAVTPYPLVMFLASTGAAGLVHATRGGLVPFAVAGVSIAGLLATDGKSLLIGLGFGALCLVLALGVPWRWNVADASPTPKLFRGMAGGGMLRIARLLLLCAPVIGSYHWMANLPVKAFTLEEMAVAYLMPGGRGENETPRNLQIGYMWGHFDDAWTIPRTLHTFWDASRNPEMAEQNRIQLRTSLQRLGLDYPGFSRRVPVVLGLCLLLPLFRRGQSLSQRMQTLLQIAAVAAVLLSCWPSIKNDYQERYVVHGTVLLPLLLMGGVAAIGQWVVGDRTWTRRFARGVGTIGAAVFLLFWTGNPVSSTHLQDRLDPVAMGGLQEFEVGQWGRENMAPGDWLLDSSWMMQALLLSGKHTVTRMPNSYPPGGAPWPAGQWRFTKPWPETPSPDATYYALVNFLAMAPDTFNAEHVPIEELITGPDSPKGKQIADDERWEEVFRTSDTIVRIYRYTPSGVPRGWPTRRKTL